MSDRFKNLGFFCLFLFLSGCSLFNGKVSEQEQKLEENKRIWSQKSPPMYTYELDRHCFCQAGLFPATIVIRADTIHAVLEPETNDTLRLGENQEPALDLYPDQYKTIPELFEVIRNAIDNEVDQLDVKYDKTLGYPVYVDINAEKRAADAGIRYEVKSLGWFSIY